MYKLENHIEALCNWALQKIYAAPTYNEALAIKCIFKREMKHIDVFDLNYNLQIMVFSIEDKLEDIIDAYEEVE